MYFRPFSCMTTLASSAMLQVSPRSTRSICVSVTDSPVFLLTCSAVSSIHRITPSSRLLQVAAFGTPLSSLIRSTVQPPTSTRRTDGSFFRYSGCRARAEYPCGNSFTSLICISYLSLSYKKRTGCSFRNRYSRNPCFSLPKLDKGSPTARMTSVFRSAFRCLISSAIAANVSR